MIVKGSTFPWGPLVLHSQMISWPRCNTIVSQPSSDYGSHHAYVVGLTQAFTNLCRSFDFIASHMKPYVGL